MDKDISETLIQLIKEKSPDSTEQLIELVKLRKLPISQDKVLECLLQLRSEGRIKLKSASRPASNRAYLRSGDARWYWITTSLALAVAVIVFEVPENAQPLALLRYIFGSIFILWLPGFSLMKVLFPRKVPISTSSSELDWIERFALSVVFSIVLVSVVGFTLNYTPWGINLTSLTLTLFGLTVILATLAIAKERQSLKEMS